MGHDRKINGLSQSPRPEEGPGTPQHAPSPTDLPEGYRMTELGPLPEEWRVVRLGEVADLKQGKTPRREQYNDKYGHRIIKVKDFKDGGRVHTIPTGDRSFVQIDLQNKVKVDDILILNAGHSASVVGQKNCS